MPRLFNLGYDIAKMSKIIVLELYIKKQLKGSRLRKKGNYHKVLQIYYMKNMLKSRMLFEHMRKVTLRLHHKTESQNIWDTRVQNHKPRNKYSRSDGMIS